MDGSTLSNLPLLDGIAQSAANGGCNPRHCRSALGQLRTDAGQARYLHVPTEMLSAPHTALPSVHSSSPFRQYIVHSHSQFRQLLSAAVARCVQAPSAPSQPQYQQPQPTPQDDLFSLDFYAPPRNPLRQPHPPRGDGLTPHYLPVDLQRTIQNVTQISILIGRNPVTSSPRISSTL